MHYRDLDKSTMFINAWVTVAYRPDLFSKKIHIIPDVSLTLKGLPHVTKIIHNMYGKAMKKNFSSHQPNSFINHIFVAPLEPMMFTTLKDIATNMLLAPFKPKNTLKSKMEQNIL